MSYAKIQQEKSLQRLTIGDNDLLIIVDMQWDFVHPTGSLYVKGAERLVESIEELSWLFHRVIISRDMHPAGHISFASAHKRKPFTKTRIGQNEYDLWPDHCVEGTQGCSLVIDVPYIEAKINKGTAMGADSYSAFYDSTPNSTGLPELLDENRPDRIYVVGVALDFCVMHTALHSLFLGYDTRVLTEYTAAVDINGLTKEAAISEMISRGIMVCDNVIFDQES